VRGAGSGVSICQYFGSSSQQSSCKDSADYEERLTKEINKNVS